MITWGRPIRMNIYSQEKVKLDVQTMSCIYMYMVTSKPYFQEARTEIQGN